MSTSELRANHITGIRACAIPEAVIASLWDEYERTCRRGMCGLGPWEDDFSPTAT
jgi:hypothetical protein